MRVATSLIPDVLQGIQQSEATLQTAYEEVSTGQSVNQPSDNPAAAAAMVQNQAETANMDQYVANGNSALAAANAADSALSSITTLMTKAVSIGTEGANTTNEESDRASLATEVQGILQSVVSEANTQYQGVAVFGGTAGSTVAFQADSNSPTGYSYVGNDETNEVAVGNSLSVQTNVPGDQVFTDSSANVLSSLSGLITALQSGTTADIGTATANVTAAMNYVSTQHVTYGNAINQLNAQESFLSQEKITLSTQANNLIGVDTATSAEELAQAETQNSSVLAAAAKVLPTSLLNYLSQ